MATSISSSDVHFASQSRTLPMIVGSTIPAVIASIFVLARFYSRVIIMKNWGHDDSWILFSWVVGSIALTTLNGILTARGTDRQNISQTPEELVVTMRLGFASRELYQVCIGTTKLGLCAFYLRIFQDRLSKVLNWSLMGFIATFTLALSLGIVFQCKPIYGDWNNIPAKCGNQAPGIVASGIVNILADILLLLFVSPRILALRITKRQKIGLLGIVCLGLLVIVAAIMRLVFTLQVLLHSKAQPWDSYGIAIWSAVEVNSGLVCASAPTVKPLIRKVAPRLLGPLSEACSLPTTDTRSKRKSTQTSLRILYSSRYSGNAFKVDTRTDVETDPNNSTT